MNVKKMELLMNIKGIKSQKKDKKILMGSKNRRWSQNFSATQYFYIAYSSAKKSQPLFCFILVFAEIFDFPLNYDTFVGN